MSVLHRDNEATLLEAAIAFGVLFSLLLLIFGMLIICLGLFVPTMSTGLITAGVCFTGVGGASALAIWWTRRTLSL
jgi:hypothetical protein